MDRYPEFTKDRLVEIATLVIDGLFEDDRDSAMEYIENVVEMDEREKEFFGIGDR